MMHVQLPWHTMEFGASGKPLGIISGVRIESRLHSGATSRIENDASLRNSHITNVEKARRLRTSGVVRFFTI